MMIQINDVDTRFQLDKSNYYDVKIVEDFSIIMNKYKKFPFDKLFNKNVRLIFDLNCNL